ncbi:uncharacterized protein LOC131805722 [Musca domestica]|uniref:Uncharacterized protein LOC131805722 n=1 Tax=Musca domestica TaxID=7370 RepID=A0ABM3VHI1_MUSDO|nr:uncharacterized protein LOC131805722 [Musca domestica]
MSLESALGEFNNEVSDNPACGVCGQSFSDAAQGRRTNCGHCFHKSCLEKCLKLRPYCPTCNTRLFSEPPPTPSGAKTRSQSKQSASAQHAPKASGSTAISQSGSSGAVGGSSGAVGGSSGACGGSDHASVDPDSLTEMIMSRVAAQQMQLFSAFSSQVAKLVQTNIEAART